MDRNVSKGQVESDRMQRQAEEIIAKLWELVGALVKSAGVRNLKTKREQLKVIEESIQQLDNKSITVPEGLLALQKNLMNEIGGAEKDLAVCYFVKEQLSQMLTRIEDTTRKEIQNTEATKQVANAQDMSLKK